MPRFTVILAGCQVAPYLPKALESLEGQTFTDFEVICYVEESTDGSLELCQEVARRDARFVVVPGLRSGAVATTRNYGIANATGECLVVLDGDDWLAPELLEKLDAKLQATGPLDVLSFAAVSVQSEEQPPEAGTLLTNFRASDEAEVFSGLEAIRRAGRNGGQMHCQTVLSAYRLDFLREFQLFQKDGKLMEDFEWTPRVWFFAKRFAYLNFVGYFYRRRPNSLTTEHSPRILTDLAAHLRSLEEFADEAQAPVDILRIWSGQWLSVFFWFLYHPVTSQKIPDAERRMALDILFAGWGKAKFKELAKRASRPKRLGARLLCLAFATGWLFPARLYFRCCYYPLLALTTRR